MPPCRGWMLLAACTMSMQGMIERAVIFRHDPDRADFLDQAARQLAPVLGSTP
jgi:hypothetical protein